MLLMTTIKIILYCFNDDINKDFQSVHFSFYSRGRNPTFIAKLKTLSERTNTLNTLYGFQ